MRHRGFALLDTFAGGDDSSVAEAFTTGTKCATASPISSATKHDRLRLLDLWNFQRKEIADAKLQPEEDAKLEAEKRVLANAERVRNAAMAAYDALYESNASAAASIRSATRQIEELSRFDEQFRDAVPELESARITIEDIGTRLRDYAEGIDASPERLAEVEDRLAALDRLKRKYGPKLDDVIALGDELERKLNEMENKDEVLRKLRQELAAAARTYLEAARGLSRQRYDAARKLEKLVESEINELAMKARFKVEVSGTDEEGNWTSPRLRPGAVSNLGQSRRAARPGRRDRLRRRAVARDAGAEDEHRIRSKQASAARTECRRCPILLAICWQEGGREGCGSQRTLVFDEIDAGIGGRAAEAVGKKLKQLSRTKQVLCITHLPQIASFADQHYLIEKREAGGRTKTSVRPLDQDERTERDCPHDERREADRNLAEARRADAEGESVERPVVGCQWPVVSLSSVVGDRYAFALGGDGRDAVASTRRCRF